MRLLPVRYFLSAILLAAATAISLVNAVSITIPPLSQCEPAEFLVQAQGNYTIDIRDGESKQRIFILHILFSDRFFHVQP